MKNFFLSIFCCMLIICIAPISKAQTSPFNQPAPLNNYPWTDSELIEPSALAGELKTGAKTPLILNIGVVEDIKGATRIGAASKDSNLVKLKHAVKAVPKNTLIVIYCGCCPFTKCPNAQPAFRELKDAGFTQVRMLNLPTNLQTDWIAKGYPVNIKQALK